MNKVLIDIREESDYIKKHFPNKDLITIDEIFEELETLDEKILELKEENMSLEERYVDKYYGYDAYDIWHDRKLMGE